MFILSLVLWHTLNTTRFNAAVKNFCEEGSDAPISAFFFQSTRGRVRGVRRNDRDMALFFVVVVG